MNHPPRRSLSADRPPLQSKRVLDQLRERIRYLHYSLKTEEAYLFWSRAYIRFHGVRHPKDMGAAEVKAFLTHLTNTRRVSVSTHKQALSALLFLYREVIGVDLPWMNEMARPTTPRRIPSVLTIEEVAALLSKTEGETGLLARLLYGTGMRLMEGLRPARPGTRHSPQGHHCQCPAVDSRFRGNDEVSCDSMGLRTIKNGLP